MKCRFRSGPNGELILQIREELKHYRQPPPMPGREWRDAKVEDLPILDWMQGSATPLFMTTDEIVDSIKRGGVA